MVKLSHSKAFVVCVIGALLFSATAIPPQNKEEKFLAQPRADKEKSLLAFNTVLKVIKSPRCINCHPSGDRPHQSDDEHVHQMNVNRGADNHGGLVQRCETCHHSENNIYSNVPGAPKWSLAPISMAWFGLSDVQIAEALTNKSKNGGRDTKALVEHLSKDSLVLWAWNPGKGRTPPPVPLDEFRKAVEDWANNGAFVPE